MRSLVPLTMLLAATVLEAGLLPLAKLDPEATRAYEKYVTGFESVASQPFLKNGALWIDGQSNQRKKDMQSGKGYTETRATITVPGGQIHHIFGTVRIPGVTVGQVASIMQSYSRYPDFFKPDITKSTGQELPDSRPEAKHFQVILEMAQATAWVDVAFETSYDTRYEKLDSQRVNGISKSTSIKEYRNAKRLAEGTLPEGADHGFLWRTYTSWHLRERDGGVDLEMNNISLSRPVPVGFGWFATRTAKSAAEKMINNMAGAVRKSMTASEKVILPETRIVLDRVALR